MDNIAIDNTINNTENNIETIGNLGSMDNSTIDIKPSKIFSQEEIDYYSLLPFDTNKDIKFNDLLKKTQNLVFHSKNYNSYLKNYKEKKKILISKSIQIASHFGGQNVLTPENPLSPKLPSSPKKSPQKNLIFPKINLKSKTRKSFLGKQPDETLNLHESNLQTEANSNTINNTISNLINENYSNSNLLPNISVFNMSIIENKSNKYLLTESEQNCGFPKDYFWKPKYKKLLNNITFDYDVIKQNNHNDFLLERITSLKKEKNKNYDTLLTANFNYGSKNEINLKVQSISIEIQI